MKRGPSNSGRPLMTTLITIEQLVPHRQDALGACRRSAERRNVYDDILKHGQREASDTVHTCYDLRYLIPRNTDDGCAAGQVKRSPAISLAMARNRKNRHVHYSRRVRLTRRAHIENTEKVVWFHSIAIRHRWQVQFATPNGTGRSNNLRPMRAPS